MVEHLVYTEGVTGSSPVSPIGEVVEWFKASVLKTDEVRASVGSNPTLSVRDVAQFGRAGALGASGRWFKSYRPDFIYNLTS